MVFPRANCSRSVETDVSTLPFPPKRENSSFTLTTGRRLPFITPAQPPIAPLDEDIPLDTTTSMKEQIVAWCKCQPLPTPTSTLLPGHPQNVTDLVWKLYLFKPVWCTSTVYKIWIGIWLNIEDWRHNIPVIHMYYVRIFFPSRPTLRISLLYQ